MIYQFKKRLIFVVLVDLAGRYGRKGVFINFVTDRDLQDLEELKNFYNTNIEEMPQNIGDIDLKNLRIIFLIKLSTDYIWIKY